MSVPPPPDYRPQPRRQPAEAPEESLTTQLFVGQPGRPMPGSSDGSSPVGSTTEGLGAAQSGSGQPRASSADARMPAEESTRVLSLEELGQIAAETHDDRIDGPYRESAAPAPRATAAHEEWADRQAAPSRWPGAAGGQPAVSGTLPPSPHPGAYDGRRSAGHAAQQPMPPQQHRPPQQPMPPQSSDPYGGAALPGGQPHVSPPAPSRAQQSHGAQQAPYGAHQGSYAAQPGWQTPPPVLPQQAGPEPLHQQAMSRPQASAGSPLPPAGPPAAGDPGKRPASSRMPGAALAVLIIAAIVIVGIVGYILVDALGGRQTAEPLPVPPPSTQSAQPSPEDAPPSSDPPQGEVTAFSSPTGNIVCTIDAERARCAIGSYDYEPPERPEGCTLDLWGSVLVANGDGAGFSCQEADAPQQAPPLAYGESVSAHGMRCTSAETGMTCEAESGEPGFTLSRGGVQIRP